MTPLRLRVDFDVFPEAPHLVAFALPEVICRGCRMRQLFRWDEIGPESGWLAVEDEYHAEKCPHASSPPKPSSETQDD